jgi:hypothetical protein
MPGFDRTGPMGAGPMTGGARGRCNPATAGTVPAYAGGYGYGRGLGFCQGESAADQRRLGNLKLMRAISILL